MTAGALLGGHARVGFENNFWLADDERAATNAELVAAVARAPADLGLEAESADALRAEASALMC